MKVQIGLAPILDDQLKVLQNSVSPTAKATPAPLPEPMGAPKSLSESDYRLVIERNSATGGYIYKTLNAITREVVSQRPAEAVTKLADSALYSPGSVINTKA
jgi:hypothetical protein